MDWRGAQEIPGRAREARERRLARHFPALRHDKNTDAGGQPCPEVFPQAEQPHAEEEKIQPLWRDWGCRKGSECEWTSETETRDNLCACWNGIPCTVTGYQQHGTARSHAAASSILNPDAKLFITSSEQQQQRTTKNNPSFSDGGKASGATATPATWSGAQDLDCPSERSAQFVAEDAFFGDNQGHLNLKRERRRRKGIILEITELFVPKRRSFC